MNDQFDDELRPGVSLDPAALGGEGEAPADEGVIEQAKDKAQQLASQAQEKAGQQVQSRLGRQKEQAANTLSSLAQSLHSSSQQLQGEQDAVSRTIQQVADRVEGLANYLQSRDVNEIVDQVEDFARRQPALFLGGAFALGALGARFLKSSRRQLVRKEVRERWDTDELTGRIQDTEWDTIGRPGAPGYAPPQERATSDYGTRGPSY